MNSNVAITKIIVDSGDTHIQGRFTHSKAGVTFDVATRGFSLNENALWLKCIAGIETALESKMRRELNHGKD